jgi:hypothetical protein
MSQKLGSLLVIRRATESGFRLQTHNKIWGISGNWENLFDEGNEIMLQVFKRENLFGFLWHRFRFAYMHPVEQ